MSEKKEEYISSIRVKELLLGDSPITDEEKRYINHVTNIWKIDLSKRDDKFYEFLESEEWRCRRGELIRGATPQNEKEKHFVEVEIPESHKRIENIFVNWANSIQQTEQCRKEFEELLIKYGKRDYVTGGKYKSEEFKELFKKVGEEAEKKVLNKMQKKVKGVGYFSSPLYNYNVRREIKKMLPRKYRHYKLTEKDMPRGFEEEMYKFFEERGMENKMDLILNDYFF